MSVALSDASSRISDTGRLAMDWTPKKHPDAPLVPKQWSIRRFANHCGLLWQSTEFCDERLRVQELCLAALAGRYWDTERQCERRIFVNPLEESDMPPLSPDYSLPDEGHYRVHRDYDSMFAVTKTLPYLCPLSVYPIAPFRETLKKPVHMTWPVEYANQTRLIELSNIPNLCLAKVGIHSKVNVMFPAMWRPNMSPAIPQSTLKEFYEEIVLPSLQDTNYEHINHWPVSYENAQKLAQDNRGQFHFGTVELPVAQLARFRRKMRHRMSAKPMFANAVFYHEIRGVKGGTHHDLTDPVARQNALQDTFKDFDFSLITDDEMRDQILVDVAIEIERPGHVVHFMEARHEDIIAYLLPSTNPSTIARMKRSDSFKLDICAQMPAVAGFRLTPGTGGRADNVRYINVYSTEKMLHYQLHPGAFDKVHPRELFQGDITKLLARLDKWTAAFFRAMGADGNATQQASGRIEIRVPANVCGTKFTDVPEDLIRAAGLAWNAQTWWNFKYWRAMACWQALKMMSSVITPQRAVDTSLQFGACIVYILNGLLYRNVTEAPYPDLHRVAAMHFDPDGDPEEWDDDDLEGGHMVPIGDGQGIFMMATIVLQGRLFYTADHRVLEPDVLGGLYGCHTIQDISVKFGVPTIQKMIPRPHPNRRNNRVLRTTHVREVLDADDVPMVEVSERARDIVIDVPQYVTGRNRRREEHQCSARELITRIWQQFKMDLLAKASNPRNVRDAGYLWCTPNEIQNPPDGLFQSPQMPFRKCKLVEVSEVKWRQMFMHYFPRPGTVITTRQQNYEQCTYLQIWKNEVMTQVPASIDAIRYEMQRIFDNMLWMPINGGDRIWNTRTSAFPGGHLCPPGFTGPAPCIGLNPHKKQGHHFAQREIDVDTRGEAITVNGAAVDRPVERMELTAAQLEGMREEEEEEEED